MLKTCLESVRRGNHPDVETIVVDSFSVDGTKDIALKSGARFIQRRAGRAAARNLGLVHSTGEYILFLDSDQKLIPGTLEKCIQIFTEIGADALKIPEVFVGGDFWGTCSALWKNTMVEAWGNEGGIPRFYRRRLLTEKARFRNGSVFWEDQELYNSLRRGVIKTAWCEGLIIHLEVGDLKEAVRKYLHYGKSSLALPKDASKANFSRTARLTMKTLAFLLCRPSSPLRIYLGTFMITAIKALSFSMGLLKEIMG